MPTIEEVEMKLNELHIDDTMRSSIKKEIAVLPTVLEPDEKIMLVISGSYQYKNGMFVATSTRLVFVDVTFRDKLTVFEFKYEDISNMNYKLGLMFGKINLYFQGKWILLDNLEKKETTRFYHFIKEKRSNPNNLRIDRLNSEGEIDTGAAMEQEVYIATKDEESLFYDLPPFQVKRRPRVQDKIARWLGFKPLDVGQKHYAKRQRNYKTAFMVYMYLFVAAAIVFSLFFVESLSLKLLIIVGMIGMGIGIHFATRKDRDEVSNTNKDSNTNVIYQYCIRYWNMALEYTISPNSATEVDVTNKFLKYGFERDHALKITQSNHFMNMSKDSISLTYYEEGLDFERKAKVGVIFQLVIPNQRAKGVGPFLLVPAGNKVKEEKYQLQEVFDTHDLYAPEEMPKSQLDEVLSFLQPLLERNIHVAIKYNRSIEIYIPDLLTQIDPIVSEEQIEQVCNDINVWYDFYERSLIWRYGQFPPEWKQREKEALEH